MKRHKLDAEIERQGRSQMSDYRELEARFRNSVGVWPSPSNIHAQGAIALADLRAQRDAEKTKASRLEDMIDWIETYHPRMIDEANERFPLPSVPATAGDEAAS